MKISRTSSLQESISRKLQPRCTQMLFLTWVMLSLREWVLKKISKSLSIITQRHQSLITPKPSSKSDKATNKGKVYKNSQRKLLTITNKQLILDTFLPSTRSESVTLMAMVYQRILNLLHSIIS